MKVEVSNGELIDKFTILEIKYNKIKDETKRTEIKKELDEQSECNYYKKMFSFYYKQLVYVNEMIWDTTDAVNLLNPEDTTLLDLYNKIFDYNKKRFRLKNLLNLLTSSNIKEQKSNKQTICKIRIQDKYVFYDKLTEINFLILEYDIIIFDSPFNLIIKQIYDIPTVKYTSEYTIDEHCICIDLHTFKIDLTQQTLTKIL